MNIFYLLLINEIRWASGRLFESKRLPSLLSISSFYALNSLRLNSQMTKINLLEHPSQLKQATSKVNYRIRNKSLPNSHIDKMIDKDLKNCSTLKNKIHLVICIYVNVLTFRLSWRYNKSCTPFSNWISSVEVLFLKTVNTLTHILVRK